MHCTGGSSPCRNLGGNKDLLAGKGTVSMAVFVVKIIIFVENVMESTEKLVERSSDGPRCKIRQVHTKCIVFLHMESEPELKRLVQDPNNMTYVGLQPMRDMKESCAEDQASSI